MPRVAIPVTGQAYSGVSPNINAQECINFIHSADQSGGKSALSLIGRFGLDLFSNIGASGIRAAITVNNTAYIVAGTKFYSVDNSGVVIEIGTIVTTAGRIGIATNSFDITFVDGSTGYIYILVSGHTSGLPQGTFAEIADADFLGGSNDIQYVDHYYVIDNTDGTMQVSALDNGNSWDALDVATPEADPDGLVRCMVLHSVIYAFGQSTTEPWYNAALSPGFPFLPNRASIMDMGLAARWSAVKADNTLYWLAQNKEGIYGIVRLSGSAPQKVSTSALDTSLRSYDTVLDCTAFSFTDNGHTFVIFTFPTAGKTWVFDAATQMWSEWQSFGLGAFRCGHHMYFNNSQILGDRTTGKLYRVNWETYTDNGDTIESTRTCQHLFSNYNEVEINSLILDMETGVGTLTGQGVDPKVMLTWSKDGGHTWSNRFDRSMGARGKYGHRVKWDRLGSASDWVLRFKITDPVKRVIIGAYAEIGTGVD